MRCIGRRIRVSLAHCGCLPADSVACLRPNPVRAVLHVQIETFFPGVDTVFRLIHTEPLPGYRIRLRYEDGVAGDVDLSHLVGKGVFRLWSDPEAFQRVCIGSSGEVRWSDEVDLCADALYLEITGKSPEELFPSTQDAQD